MHPDMMRDMADQRGREMRARARENELARRARKELRRQRRHAAAAFVLPRIPDYVDGTFRDAEDAGARHADGEHAARAGGRAA
jgi:hypothetical protein